MNEENKIVECVECGDIHFWSERVEKYDPEYCWTSHFCPKCGEESYYPLEYNAGDIVPYKNTRGNIKLAKITSFETIDNGKIWFHGIDTVTNAKVWYPVHISKTLKSN